MPSPMPVPGDTERNKPVWSISLWANSWGKGQQTYIKYVMITRSENENMLWKDISKEVEVRSLIRKSVHYTHIHQHSNSCDPDSSVVAVSMVLTVFINYKIAATTIPLI